MERQPLLTVEYSNSQTGASGYFKGTADDVRSYVESIISSKSNQISEDERKRGLQEAMDAIRRQESEAIRIQEKIKAGEGISGGVVVAVVVISLVAGGFIGLGIGLAIATVAA